MTNAAPSWRPRKSSRFRRLAASESLPPLDDTRACSRPAAHFVSSRCSRLACITSIRVDIAWAPRACVICKCSKSRPDESACEQQGLEREKDAPACAQPPCLPALPAPLSYRAAECGPDPDDRAAAAFAAAAARGQPQEPQPAAQAWPQVRRVLKTGAKRRVVGGEG